jgi:hypothetical protein
MFKALADDGSSLDHIARRYKARARSAADARLLDAVGNA